MIISSDGFPMNEGRKSLRPQEKLLEKAGIVCREAIYHCEPLSMYIPVFPCVDPLCKLDHKCFSNIDRSLNFLRARGVIIRKINFLAFFFVLFFNIGCMYFVDKIAEV